MGDVPSDQTKSPRGAAVEEASSTRKPSVSTRVHDTNPPGHTQSTPTQSVAQALRPVGVEYYAGPHGFVTTATGQGGRPSALSMGEMSSALPSYQPPAMPFDQQSMQQHFLSLHQSQGMVYPIPQMSHFPGQVPGGNPAYNIPYSPAFQTAYGQQSQHAHLHGASGYQPYIQSSPAHQSTVVSGQAPVYGQAYYHPQPYAPSFGQTMQAGVPMHQRQQATEYMTHQGAPSSATVAPRKEPERRPSTAVYDVASTIVDGSSPGQTGRAMSQMQDSSPQRLPSISGPSTPRGPPRKPKQSGHALWVGNLPPGANVVDLKDHFSRDATDDIESVFLISKSNCAFVNYKTDAACTAAMARFHDSRFQGVRLVCRLRRGLTIPGSSVTTTVPSSPATQSPRTQEGPIDFVDEEAGSSQESGAANEGAPEKPQPPSTARVPERYFIVKSLTVEDLELSRQSGIWATQAHNEATLNRAYETADNVYLIFSANKSGEYFGYARMISPINDEESQTLEMPSRPNVPAEPEILNVTATEATATAPKGRIIDDSARGTIFWEANSSEDEDDDGTRSEKSVEETTEEAGTTGTQSFGKPFRIEWMSTGRLPFYRTRGLRNPWNANREVKIARDGTEIEPSVGRKLTQLFHVQPTASSTSLGSSSGQPHSYHLPPQSPY
ncbi:hypothetical protein DTO164E3_8619 [Paecilomyces variotii]|nr:hypothetical protein DTO164E3_8619 [Paecilomyces variotii]KAJ9200554.1 hypothetical protein DTO032I3_4436 [Paecilomyces variotii]KAJ9229470.1 hypothetical protein DTO169E5_8862 [Paecilomyces variotii]KAJ9278682.1 hypothetical protein DTO021D3_4305 [Paecilomyces variotii]KAJ9289587.1 hypothetical protein DTO021C3_2658 [Paecilomyces variotii]